MTASNVEHKCHHSSSHREMWSIFSLKKSTEGFSWGKDVSSLLKLAWQFNWPFFSACSALPQLYTVCWSGWFRLAYDRQKICPIIWPVFFESAKSFPNSFKQWLPRWFRVTNHLVCQVKRLLEQKQKWPKSDQILLMNLSARHESAAFMFTLYM